MWVSYGDELPPTDAVEEEVGRVIESVGNRHHHPAGRYGALQKTEGYKRDVN